MNCIIKAYILVGLVILVLGCRSQEITTFVVGQNNELSKVDKQDFALGENVAGDYVDAWLRQDYNKMWMLRCKKSVSDYGMFEKLAIAWRTKGVKNASSINISDAKDITESFVILSKLSDEQAQVILSLAIVDKEAYEKLKHKTWPNRVMFIKLDIKGYSSLLLLVKEKDQWSVANDPGTLDINDVLPAWRDKV